MGSFWKYFAVIAALAFLALNVAFHVVLLARMERPAEPINVEVAPNRPVVKVIEGGGARVTRMELVHDHALAGLVVRTQFSDDIVTPAEVGLGLNSSPVIFKPALQGVFRWESPRVLLFIVEKAPSFVNLSASLNPALCDTLGRPIRGLRTFALAAPALELVSARQEGLSAGGCPVLLLVFNDKVNPHQLYGLMDLAWGGVRQASGSFTVLGAAPASEVRVALKTPVAGAIDLSLRQGLAGLALCPLPAEVATRVPVQGSLILVSATPQQRSGGFFEVELSFNGRVDAEELKRRIELDPPIAHSVQAENGATRVWARFKPGTAYTLRVRKGMRSSDGLVLEDDLNRHLVFPDLDPEITLSGEGYYIPRRADLTLPVRTMNVSEIAVQAMRLYENNIVEYLRGDAYAFRGRRWYSDQDMPAYTAMELPQTTVKINGKWNTWTDTTLDLRELCGPSPRGTYAVRACIAERYYGGVSTVLQVTDLGITLTRGPSSLLAWVTTLGGAEPVAGARVTVRSRTNQLVAEGQTDAAGLFLYEGTLPWEYAEGPFVVIASHGDDLAFVAIEDTQVEPLDDLPGGASYLDEGYEAFVWSESGVYRPGEEVNVYAVVRDGFMRGPAAFPVRFRIVRPDGREWRTITAGLSEFATAHAAFTVPAYMATGNYRVEALGAGDAILGRRTFLIEEIRADRMRVHVAVSPARPSVGQVSEVVVSAQQFFGTAAAGRTVEGRLILRPYRFSAPLHDGFSFSTKGQDQDAPERTVALGLKELDADGRARFEVLIPGDPLPRERFLAEFVCTVSETGGRSVTARRVLPVDAYPVYMGIACDTPQPSAGLETHFRIEALNPDGSAAAVSSATLTVREIIWYHGYERSRQGGGWTWVNRREERNVTAVAMALMDGKARWSFVPERPAQYVIRVESPATRHAAEYEFHAGGPGWSPRSFKNPAHVAITAKETTLRPGTDAELEILSPFDGLALVVVEGARLHHAHAAPVVRGNNRFMIPITDDMWPNAYVTCQVVRPYWPQAAVRDLAARAAGGAPVEGGASVEDGVSVDGGGAVDGEAVVAEGAPAPAAGPDAAVLVAAIVSEGEPRAAPSAANPDAAEREAPAGKSPYRAFGVMPLRLDPAPRRIKVALEVSRQVRPGESIEVRAATTDHEGVPVRSEMVLALVDEGLLSLTAEAPPDPLGFFARLRARACTTSDVYSHVVPGRRLAPGGGDDGAEGLGKRRLNPVQYEAEKPVVFFFPPSVTDADGRAQITVQAPDFAGALRLVALAVTGDRAGAAHDAVVVKPDIVLRATYPRCLAPGDTAVVPLVLFNNTGEDRTLTVAAEADGAVAAQGGGEVIVPAGKDAVARVVLTARDACGVAKVALRVTGGGLDQETRGEFPVRPPWSACAVSWSGVVNAGETAQVLPPDSDPLPAMFAGTEEAVLVVSGSPLSEFAPAVRFLIGYPHGCAEQTASRLLALSAARRLGLKGAADGVDALIAAGIERLASMQTTSGALAYWPGGGDPAPWVSVFAAHVLLTVRQGHEILVDDVLKDLLDYVETCVTADKEGLDIRAYAAYVCTCAGRDVSSQTLRLAEENLSVRAVRFVSCALKLQGEDSAAGRLLGRRVRGEKWEGSYIASGVEEAIELITEVQMGRARGARALVDRLKGLAGRRWHWGNTHACAWAFLALGEWAAALGFDGAGEPEVELALGGRSLHSGPLAASRQFTLALEDLPKIAVTASRGAVFYSWTVSGIPREEQPQVAVPDFSVSRRYLDFDGAQIDGEFVLGRPYIAELTFHSVRSLENVVVSDLLPGGLEIENPRLASRVGAPVTDTGGGEVQEETHVIRPQQVEMRDDRLLVFADLPVRDSTVAVYRYVVRAVAEGEFRLPPVAAECMYDPAMCAASSGGRIRVRLPSAH